MTRLTRRVPHVAFIAFNEVVVCDVVAVIARRLRPHVILLTCLHFPSLRARRTATR